MTEEELTGIIELRENHRRRLLELEKRHALKGVDVDVATTIEIEDIRLKIEEIDRRVSKRILSQANWTDRFVDAGDDTKSIQAVSDRLTALGQYMIYREDSIRKEIAGMWKMMVEQKEKDTILRINRQRVTNILYVIIIVLLIIVVFK